MYHVAAIYSSNKNYSIFHNRGNLKRLILQTWNWTLLYGFTDLHKVYKHLLLGKP